MNTPRRDGGLMLHDRSYTGTRWSVVVPVRRGRFIAPRASLEPFNVEADLTELRPFGDRKSVV